MIIQAPRLRGFCFRAPIRLMDKILHDPKDPKLYQNFLFLIMGNATQAPILLKLKPLGPLEPRIRF